MYILKNQVNLDTLIINNHSIPKAKFGLIFLKKRIIIKIVKRRRVCRKKRLARLPITMGISAWA